MALLLSQMLSQSMVANSPKLTPGGRGVAEKMAGALGFLVQEQFHPIFPQFGGPAIRQLDLVLTTENGELIGSILLMAIWFSEFARARIGWMEPEVEMRTLREGYMPGDLNWDPLGMKPKSEAELLTMQTKELNNGRLAML